MIPTVVIGGERRIVDEDITPRLNKHGLDVIDVFPMDKEMGDLPKDAKVFFFVTNMMSHRHNDFAKAEAERRGNVKVIYGTSKGSIITQRLVDAGYPEVQETVNTTTAFDRESAIVRISNPKLPGGFYMATVMDGDIDEEKMMMMYHVDYGPEGAKYAGKIYTDVLLRKEEYASGKPIDQLLAFLSSIGVELGKTNKGLADMKARQDRLYGKTVYFQLMPANGGTRVVYLDSSIWQVKSANQRRRYPINAAKTNELPPIIVELIAPVMEEVMPPSPALSIVPPAETKPAAPQWANPGITDEQKATYVKLLRYIAENPLVTKEDGATYLGCSPLNSTYDKFWQTARRTLGIHSIRTSPVSIHHPTYDPMCASLGIPPVEWTTKARPLRRAATAPLVPVVTPPPVVAAPAAEVPDVEPVVAETSAPSDDLAELREILALLRDEMVKRDIRRMVVTPSGVDFTRVVTVEAKMEF
jgi:hypothetical protein